MRLRSLLFVPGDRPERVPKAGASGADAIIIDLEDSVAPDKKSSARETTTRILSDPPVEQPIFVRVNPLGSAFLEDDLPIAAQAQGVVLPKAEGAQSIARLDEMSPGLPPILPIATETPGAVFELGSYRRCAGRLAGISWGAEDLPAAIGAATSRADDGSYLPPYEMVRSLTLFAAHAAGAHAIDTVFPAIRDLDGLARYARRAARDGFTGMLALHPDQIGPINDAFTPDEDEINRARRIVDAFAAQPNAGVLMLDGQMVDAPHLKQAKALLARARP